MFDGEVCALHAHTPLLALLLNHITETYGFTDVIRKDRNVSHLDIEA